MTTLRSRPALVLGAGISASLVVVGLAAAALGAKTATVTPSRREGAVTVPAGIEPNPAAPRPYFPADVTQIPATGSLPYVAGLSTAERDRIALYMNYDMVCSPNYIFMVYDADESSFPAPVPVPPGSAAIEDVYESYYTMVGEPYDDTAFSGRSDYQAFILAGIPSAGLFTGAEQIKTAEQVAIWGGVADEQTDQCYHLVCDNIGNLNAHALEVNSDLIAFAMLTFANSTESVNGVPGQPVPGSPSPLPAPAGPEGTFVADDGGHGPGPATS